MTTILSSYIRDTSPTIHDIAFIQREVQLARGLRRGLDAKCKKDNS